MLGSAPLFLVLAAGLVGAVVGWFLPRVVRRYSPVTDEPTSAPSRPFLLVTTAALFVIVAAFFGLSWQLPAYSFFAVVAVVLTVIDLRHHLLPNAVVLPALGIGFVLLALAAAGENAWGALLRAVLGALVLFVLYLVLALISPAGLGMGDVKLAAVLGLFLGFQGWGALFVGAVLASVVGMVVGLAVLASRRGGLRSDVPFGPSMLAGALVAVVWGELLAREYLLSGLY
ncbi:prepilin peptidase [Kocuria rhizosphaericola]|uniref:prepilin peptidase n=1 Tax=Kocuria rhizosphaericola TaxID=3376284 RepID=UPI0037961F88